MKKKLKELRLNTKVMFLVGLLIGLIISATGIYAATLVDSVNVTYDNSTSSLESENVQDALDELYGMCKVSTLSSYITALYSNATHTSVTTAGDELITQASSVGLMEDSYGNIRYYGASPDNYVSFNDELWRIIGVFEVEDDKGITQTRVKIVRNESIGTLSYDNKPSGYGTSTSAYGSGNWSDARTMMLLNYGYEGGATDSSGNTIYAYEGSLYWNSSSGTCYAGSTEGTTSCDFTSTGLGDEIKSVIGQAKYYLGGLSSSSVYADDAYLSERGTDVYSDYDTEWVGYIGLIYLSDYGYASDLNSCTSYLYSYTSSGCYSTNWLYYMASSNGMWTLTNASSGNIEQNYVYNIFVVARANSINPGNPYGIFPVAYLNASVTITSGDGTEDNPYIIE